MIDFRASTITQTQPNFLFFMFSAYICFRVSTGQVIDGLDKAVLSMKKNEHALVTIAPEYGFKAEETKRDLATVPANSTLIYEIELVEFVKVITFL